MIKKDEASMVRTIVECITDTYEHCGIDMIPMYNTMEKNFPNVLTAIGKMYSNFNLPNLYDVELLNFENPQYVYEAISALIPSQKRILFNVTTESQAKQFQKLNLCSYGHFVCGRRLNLIIAILLCTEEFVLQPITSRNVSFTDTELLVYGTSVTFRVSKHEEKTCVSIEIHGSMLLKCEIRN